MQYKIQHTDHPDGPSLIFSTIKPCFFRIDLTNESPSGELGSIEPNFFSISAIARRKSVCKETGSESMENDASGLGRPSTS